MVKLVVCGGGNGAHTLAALASARGHDVAVLTLYADEALRWTNVLKDNDMTVTIHSPSEPTKTVVSKPRLVTKHPEDAVPGVDIVILCVPAFAHKQYLEAIKPHVTPGLVVAGLPGAAGLEFALWGILGEKGKQCSLVSFESLPWATRITKFGKATDVLGTKGELLGSLYMGNPVPKQDPVDMVQSIVGDVPKLIPRGHLVGISLAAPLHPSIMYGEWAEYDGTPLESPPLFYQGITDIHANLIETTGDEAVAVANEITRQRPQVDLSNVESQYNWYMRVYDNDITDKTNLRTAIVTNKSYKGLVHPVKKTSDGKFVPDFHHRYLTEDLPYCLVVIKGIAEIVNVPTPVSDKILMWAQDKIGKEYLVAGKLTGKDVGESRSPQAFGLTSLDAILGL